MTIIFLRKDNLAIKRPPSCSSLESCLSKLYARDRAILKVNGFKKSSTCCVFFKCKLQSFSYVIIDKAGQ